MVAFTTIIAACSGSNGASAPEEGSSGSTEGTSDSEEDVIEVGILHSLSGTMAISETSVRNTIILNLRINWL